MKNLIHKDEVVEILKQCFDPELPVDLWNLGLIYDIQIQEAYDETKSDINIIMSLTTPGCTTRREEHPTSRRLLPGEGFLTSWE